MATGRSGRGELEVNFSTHKDRSHWFFRRATFPLRDAAPLALERFWEHQESYPHVRNLHWESAGPINIAGRVTSLVVHPWDPQKLYAGAAAGGVWYSEDGGGSWSSCWPLYLNHNIGALAIHPTDGNSLICATGEGNLSADSYPGSGIYQTSDGGLTWMPYFTAPGGSLLSENAQAALPRRVGTIAFGMGNDGQYHIALGAVSSNESLPAALYIDEGAEGLQPNTFWGIRSYNCHSVVFHPGPGKPGCLYVAIEPGGTQNGIWRSDDFGKTWRRLQRGMPPGEICGRISLAISPSDPQILYAQVASRDHNVLGVFRSANGGESWREIGGRHFARERQMAYNNAIAVHPKHPNYVVCGGVDLHCTTDGGKKWRRITTGKRGTPGRFPRNFVHSDHHAVLITADGAIYSGNDGGIAMSDDGGKTWKNRSHGMVTAMFYAADVAQSNSKVFGGGTQDNGTLIAGVPAKPGEPAPGAAEFTRVLPGDGGWLEFDRTDEEHVFGATSDLIFSRHRQGEPWANGRQLASWANVSISADSISPGEKAQRAIVVMEIEPSRSRGVKKLWVGTTRVWQTINDGKVWKPVSPTFDGSAISAIECAAANPRVMYVGTSDGGIFRGIFRGTGGDVAWSANLAGAVIPKRMITSIGTHPKSARIVVATVASSGVPGTSLHRTREGGSGKDLPYAHVFRSDDEAETWRALDGDSPSDTLPDVVYNALAFETHPPYRLFVGGDAGVWMSVAPDAAGGWASVAGNMPNVVVSDLIFHDKDQILTAATFGRGIWRLKVTEPFPVVKRETKRERKMDASDTPPAAGLIRDPTIPAPVLLSPPDGAEFQNSPGSMHLTWQPVSRAIAYVVCVVEAIEKGGITRAISSIKPELTYEVGSPGTSRWQVWAILPGSRRSPGSGTRTFRYMLTRAGAGAAGS